MFIFRVYLYCKLDTLVTQSLKNYSLNQLFLFLKLKLNHENKENIQTNKYEYKTLFTLSLRIVIFHEFTLK